MCFVPTLVSKSKFFALDAEQVTLGIRLIFSPKLRKFRFKSLEQTRITEPLAALLKALLIDEAMLLCRVEEDDRD
uniref:Uncharacterized protein n=1 Tax=Romanomermis culicivorax TaxID=13658 RepID=A0A915L5X3_ROMCU